MGKQGDSQTIGNRIKELRKEKGMSQMELAESSKLDVLTVIELESGKSEPTVGELIAIAKTLDMAMPELFRGVV
ncbi:helix-turn-helix transcriptional regulator [Mucilaginibacter pedocola]|uniref:HTH cro/C1-type domain-containing protein n=1 Tax=Mucilaginibacter pedocola TaxID=1792845 RepID=A0A1S9PHC2_9SPHI|nr:helix-turn-helix transcriptional regulator [Mucilaginibacter pedocola]OOQ60360.1 hypothetical protein BC343_25390 [Mucilaginibacter pedocola]